MRTWGKNVSGRRRSWCQGFGVHTSLSKRGMPLKIVVSVGEMRPKGH